MAVKNVDTDLFGDPAAQPGTNLLPKPPPRQPSNDMEACETILAAAMSDRAFVLAGTTGRVCRIVEEPVYAGSHKISGSTVKPVSRADAELVMYLIRQKFLSTGGAKTYQFTNHRECLGYAVSVPKKTRQLAHRWSNLHRPDGWAMQTKPEKPATTSGRKSRGKG